MDRSRLERKWLPLLLVFVLGLGLRIADHRNKPCLSRDSMLYVTCAEKSELSADMRTGFWRLPYVYFLKLARPLGMDVRNFGVAVNILCGAMAGVMIMLIADRASIPGGFWAGVYLATAPYLIKWSTEVQREALFMLLVLASIYVFFSYLDIGKLSLLILSECIGFCSLLVRAEGMEVISAILLGVAVGARNTRDRRVWQDIVAAAATVAVLSLAYFVFITAMAGERPDIRLGKIIHSWKF